MTTITKQQFINSTFGKGKILDPADLERSTRTRSGNRAKLLIKLIDNAVSVGDKVVSEKEWGKLFDQIDTKDRDGNIDTVDRDTFQVNSLMNFVEKYSKRRSVHI